MELSRLPLNALRAFDAAARHLSFTRAAQELNVTPGAVARQVHGLEERLGVQLVSRNGPSFSLTDCGRRALPSIRQGFIELSSAVDQMTRSTSRPLITLSADSTFASLWLAPRLSSFRALEPACSIRIVSPLDYADDLPDYVDLAITYSKAKTTGFVVRLLQVEHLIPVMSRALFEELSPDKPEDLLNASLISLDVGNSEDPYPGWPEWFRQNGISYNPDGAGIHVGLILLALQAATAGQGIALASDVLAKSYLDRGDLVAPLSADFSFTLNRYILHRKSGQTGYIQKFLTWLSTQS